MLLRSNFSSFPQYFQYISNLGVKLHIHSVKGGCSINCFPQFRKYDTEVWISRTVSLESLGFRDNESRLYFVDCSRLYRNTPDHPMTSRPGPIVVSLEHTDDPETQRLNISWRK